MVSHKLNMDPTEKVHLPFLKRLFDIVICLLLLILFVPFMLVMLAWIILEQLLIASSRGPLLYREVRMSQGEPFLFVKIRTFKQSVIDKARRRCVVHTKDLEQDTRNFTGYGRFLYRVYLDELPQLFNVLKGDLTMVGPRPTNPERNAELIENNLNTKNQMKCGLTGPYQAAKGTGARSDYEMDRQYINFVKAHSGWQVVCNDLNILYQTGFAVFRAAGE